jgi:hypothetical protein
LGEGGIRPVSTGAASVACTARGVLGFVGARYPALRVIPCLAVPPCTRASWPIVLVTGTSPNLWFYQCIAVR